MIVARVFVQTIALALGQIRANKVRAMLTALGIIVGVGSVAAVIAALQGMQAYVLSEFESFGTKKVYIDDNIPRELRGKVHWRDVLLTEEEVQAIAAHAPAVVRITPMRHSAYEVSHGQVTLESVSVVGIWPQWHEIEGRDVEVGRKFNRIDEAEKRQVCLINDKAVEELDLNRNPVGEHINIAGRRFLIVGKVETKDVGAMFGGGETQSEIFIPMSVAKKLNPRGWINYAMAELASPELAEEATAQIRMILRTMRGIKPGEPETFEVQVMQEFLDRFKALAAGMTAVGAGIVSVSLLVGGIGIMNIMLVSVSERTREIGLRKAVGAKPSVILFQFLTEAVTLCLVGGMAGLALGQALTLLIQRIPGANLEQAAIPLWAMALALAFSASVGVIFGMFPAIKAARLDPIEALRHE
ncbi:MAG: FtsX-like permease family protein [Planctomycetota bacterium]|nr:MAG: FtsX-like permease family protein [Planctomycetota bacterium]